MLSCPEMTTDPRVDELSDRGRKTRAALVDAASRVFERRGFHATRIADVTEAAGVAVGSFYTYFESKIDILRAVLHGVEEEVWSVLALRTVRGDPPQTRIRVTNELAVDSYRRHARFWAVLEEASLTDPEARALLIERHRQYRQRTQNAIAAWQADGLVSPDLDAEFAAFALGSMTERCAYLWFVLGEPIDRHDAARKLTTIWHTVLGLDTNSSM
jgi:AcrR family transcriptional regulator